LQPQTFLEAKLIIVVIQKVFTSVAQPVNVANTRTYVLSSEKKPEGKDTHANPRRLERQSCSGWHHTMGQP